MDVAYPRLVMDSFAVDITQHTQQTSAFFAVRDGDALFPNYFEKTCYCMSTISVAVFPVQLLNYLQTTLTYSFTLIEITDVRYQSSILKIRDCFRVGIKRG